jgi:hypothetical protein
VLTEWCSIILQSLSKDLEAPLRVVLEVIAANAKTLELSVGGQSRFSVKKSALRVSRRALRAAFSRNDGEEVIRETVEKLTNDSSSCQRNAPFLGVVAGVSARLPDKSSILGNCKGAVLKFYTKEILGSRTVVPHHIASGLSDFFSSFATLEDIRTEVVPVLEKVTLRSPEIILSGIISELCHSLSDEVDLSEVVYSRLSKPLIASLKSTNPVIRQGAVDSFAAVIGKCGSEEWLLKVSSELLGPLKTNKVPNAEHRALFAQVLFTFPCFPSLSLELVTGLVQTVSRESNEVALEMELKALCKHLASTLDSKKDPGGEVAKAIMKGAAAKKIPIRKLWMTMEHRD